MDIAKASQAMVNGIYGAVAWLILDLGMMLEQQGSQFLEALVSRPEMIAGVVIVILCIVGLVFKSRLAASVLFLLFLIPLLIRVVQGAIPSTMVLIFSLILLYLFLAAMLGAFRYHHLKSLEEEPPETG